MRIYTDLDETLIGNVVGPDGNVLKIYPRPGAGWFLRSLANHGDVWMLTAAERGHAERALRKLGPEAKYLKGVLSREDMKPVEEQIAVVLETPGLSDEVRLELWDEIKPIAPPGIMFDDFPVGSSMYALKSKSLGIDEDQWVQVEPYRVGVPDRHGLKRAYSEFLARFGGQELGVRRGKKVALWR